MARPTAGGPAGPPSPSGPTRPGSASLRTAVPPTFQTGLLLLELRLVDLVVGDLVGDGAPRQAGEAGGAADVAAGPLEGAAEVALLEGGGQLGELIGQRPGQVDGELVAGRAGLEDLRGEVLRPDHVVPRGHAGPLHGVLQLADVPRPTVLEQRLHGLRRDGLGGHAR